MHHGSLWRGWSTEEMIKQGVTFVIQSPSQSFQEKVQHQNNLTIFSVFCLLDNPSRLVHVIEVKTAGKLLEESSHFICTSSISVNLNHGSQMFIERAIFFKGETQYALENVC